MGAEFSRIYGSFNCIIINIMIPELHINLHHQLVFLFSSIATVITINMQYCNIIQLLKLVSSADWSKVHHVTNGILGKDW